VNFVAAWTFDALEKAVSSSASPDLFDLGTAHDLYSALFAPIEGLTKTDGPDLHWERHVRTGVCLV
jgi:hypothetical protein